MGGDIGKYAQRKIAKTNPILLLHQRVVEGMAALGALGGP